MLQFAGFGYQITVKPVSTINGNLDIKIMGGTVGQ